MHDSADAIGSRTTPESSIPNFFKHSALHPVANNRIARPNEAGDIHQRSIPADDRFTTSVAEADFDIDIPSFTQLHLSQVNQLPSPMKRAILSKLHTANEGRKIMYETENNSTRDARLLQTDMRRMMKLAAVKNGDEIIPGSSDIGVSMSQLESLPLEMQLQIANGDDMPIGSLSRKSRNCFLVASSGRSVTSKAGTVAFDRSDRSKPRRDILLQESATNCDAEVVIVDSDSDDQDYSAPISSELTKQSFYQVNVKPLMVFMDENNCNNEEAVGQVLEFFRVVLADEGRHHEAVVLLRSVKRREDAWCEYPFNLILEEVNSALQRSFGHELDPQLFEN